jgi:hypothetical protein
MASKAERARAALSDSGSSSSRSRAGLSLAAIDSRSVDHNADGRWILTFSPFSAFWVACLNHARLLRLSSGSNGSTGRSRLHVVESGVGIARADDRAEGERRMISKEYTKTGRSCRVTFELPPDIRAESAAVVGEFNDWNQASTKMKRSVNGGFSATISLKPGNEYRFRYLLDGERWENDHAADRYVANGHGSEDSVVVV